MTVVTALDALTEWARENICSKIKLKVPPTDDQAPDDAGYEYQLTNPAAFTMYVPTKEKLPPAILSPIPSVCVRFVEGADDMSGGNGTISVELCFSTWDPGAHGKDIIMPNPDSPMEPKRWSGPEADAYFRRNGDGWRDAWNMVDIALREIESATNIGSLVIDRSVPVKFGPLKEQESIPDFYPFWFAWVSFTVSYPIVRNIRGVENLL